MNRSPLLLEVLVTRQITRPGPVYLYRHPTGPEPSKYKEADLDRFLHRTSQRFDFGPLMNGDQQQARQVAMDYLAFLQREARKENIPFDVIRERLKKISAHMRRGLLTFWTYLDARVKTKS